MIVVDWRSEACVRHIVAIFGVGLVGEAIGNRLQSAHVAAIADFPFSWEDPEAWAAQFSAIAACIGGLVERAEGGSQIDLVWSAGRAGFAGAEEDFRQEIESFKSILAFAQSLAALPAQPPVRFHLISSAGGLFEAQHHVSPTSIPKPLRAYGRAKLEQETLLAGLPKHVARVVYRLSSVYGFSKGGDRLGLIGTLIQSAINNRTTPIFGKPETLRDYVFADDVGKFVAQRIAARGGASETLLLASGKPSSVAEVIGLIEHVLDRKLLLQFELGDNTSSNTFAPAAGPVDWRPTPLETGVAQTAMRLRNDFAAAPKARSC